MEVEEIKGRLDSLGSGTIFNHRIMVYHSLEIGGKMRQKIRAACPMDDMLRDAVGDEITIFLLDNYVVGIKRSNGKSYAMKEECRLGVPSLIFCVVLVPVWGLGLVLLWGRHKAVHKTRARDKIRANLPNATLIEE